MTIDQGKRPTVHHVSCPAANASTSDIHKICLAKSNHELTLLHKVTARQARMNTNLNLPGSTGCQSATGRIRRGEPVGFGCQPKQPLRNPFNHGLHRFLGWLTDTSALGNPEDASSQYLILHTKSDILSLDGMLSECQNSDCEYDKDGFSVVYNQGSGSDSGVAAPAVPHRRRNKSCGAGDARRNSAKTDDGCKHPAIARPDKAQTRRRTVCPVVGEI
jgi:hypothetical protein